MGKVIKVDERIELISSSHDHYLVAAIASARDDREAVIRTLKDMTDVGTSITAAYYLLSKSYEAIGDQDLAHTHLAPPPAALGRQDQRRDQRPLSIAQIAGIASALALVKTSVLARPHWIWPPLLECMTLPPRARSHAGTHREDDQMAVNPMADYYRRVPQWELSEMTVHPANIVSGGENSSEAVSSHPMKSGSRYGKSRALANFFDKPVKIDSFSRAVSMPSF